jgi:DNA-binding transcriptional MocR family regulator
MQKWTLRLQQKFLTWPKRIPAIFLNYFRPSMVAFNARGKMVTQPPKRPINLLRGWPNASLLPQAQLLAASQTALSNQSVATDGMLYGPDDGYLPLRQEISKWLSSFYDCPDEVQRICITGGASQNLACILQVFTDPSVTRAVWMVAPCYFLACRIFEDAGFVGRLRAVPEDADGIDVHYLQREIEKLPKSKVPDRVSSILAFDIISLSSADMTLNDVLCTCLPEQGHETSSTMEQNI